MYIMQIHKYSPITGNTLYIYNIYMCITDYFLGTHSRKVPGPKHFKDVS